MFSFFATGLKFMVWGKTCSVEERTIVKKKGLRRTLLFVSDYIPNTNNTTVLFAGVAVSVAARSWPDVILPPLILSFSKAKLTDWLAKWLTDWLAGWMTDWIADWLDSLLTDWLADCLPAWLTDWLAGWLADWRNDWLDSWLNDWLTDWLAGWLAEWLTG